MTSPEQENMTNSQILSRCVEYIDGWYGIAEKDIARRNELWPQEAHAARVEMYEMLLQKSDVTKETVAVAGFKAIMSARYPRPEPQLKEIVVSLVPRITEKVIIEDCPDTTEDSIPGEGYVSPLDRIRAVTENDGLALFRVAVEATAAHKEAESRLHHG